MAKVKDIILDENSDLTIKSGDFVVEESDDQHIEQIILSAQGSWRQYPLLGFNVTTYLKAPDTIQSRFVRNLKVHLEDLDGYKVGRIDVSKGFDNIILEADRA